ncbi:Down syndrome cell adhesion molecule [Amphibalanus amphitrite]|uniref:Down syndrome cell adhesion molecule n=1 Tax=Amphibalanus amphitrite TaxID=1232801 RepID=A0A6A4XAK6_AMPAM|nr:Down syndrome cell adhesion molecule [Amphibalanus amphitrite]KAF0311372.1 Down syndrome cell adhesion molecule [Amphibalanus amphitrite]
MTNILDAIRCADENMHAAHPPSGGADGCLSPLTVAEIGGRENGYSADKGVDEPLRRAAPHGITVPARFQQRQRAASVVSGAVRHGEDSTARHVIVTERPEPPSDRRLASVTLRSVLVAWPPRYDGNSVVAHYVVQCSLTHGRIQATYVRLADQITLTRSVRRPELVLLLKHLQPNTAYSVPMSACNRAGQGPASSPVTATTEEGVPELPVAGRRREGPFPADLDVAELCSLLPVTVYQLLVSAHSAAGTTESTTRLAIHAADGAMISPLPPPEKSVNGRQ